MYANVACNSIVKFQNVLSLGSLTPNHDEMKKNVSMIALLIVALLATAYFIVSKSETSIQSEYVKNFDWMVQTFEQNDAGFPYYLEEKGADDYARHIASYRKRIRKAKSEQEYLFLMNDWLHYFRKNHIGVLPQYGSKLSEKEEKDFIDFDESAFKLYLQQNRTHPIEGIWKGTRNNLFGIVRSKNDTAQFDIFMLRCGHTRRAPKQLIAEITESGGDTINGTFHGVDGSKKKATGQWIGKSHSIISLSGLVWAKIYPETNHSEQENFFIESMCTDKPLIRQLNSNTIYLRIPSFDITYRETIHKLLSENDNIIKSARNLIIDIRNGTGGSDYCHYDLIPYYYTQPIRVSQLKYRATELNAQAYDRAAKIHKDSSGIRHAQQIAHDLREHPNEYLDYGALTSIISGYESLERPARVAIICNQNNASADEGFLYLARQSYKVKIFGKPTKGAFNCSNMNTIDFPKGKYTLFLAITVNKIYPEYRIDDIGIQPDYYIDDDIRPEEWVAYVQNVIETG